MVQQYDIAHIHEQGVDLIIVPLEASFGLMNNAAQAAITADLQQCATSTGLRGTVVPVWYDGGGRMAFRAPRPWHAFFESTDLFTIGQNINGRLTCD